MRPAEQNNSLFMTAPDEFARDLKPCWVVRYLGGCCGAINITCPPNQTFCMAKNEVS